MINLLIYAYRDWSFENIAPVLQDFKWNRWWAEKPGLPPDFASYDAIITCEPHIEGWRQTYPLISGRHKILALQQGLFWSDEYNPNAVWLFDKMMVWGQMMVDALSDYHISDRLILSGNPKFDAAFRTTVQDDGYTLILGSGCESIRAYRPLIKQMGSNCKFLPHPNRTGHKLTEDTSDLIRRAHRVVFKCTGAGLTAMIMNKPVMILPYVHQKSYMPCKLYNTNAFGHDPEYVEYAVYCVNATKRIRSVIEDFVGGH